MLETVAEAAASLNLEAPTYRMFRDYHTGNHHYDFVTPKFRDKFGWALRFAQENLCPAVVSAYVDRLSIESWGDAEAIDEATESGLQRLANLVHTEAHVAGNAFTITWNRPGTAEPLAVFHRADQVVPYVDPEQPDRLLHLVKLWMAKDGVARANIYTDTHLLRYQSKSKITTAHGVTPQFHEDVRAWEPFEAEGAPAEERHDFRTVPAVWWKRAAPSQFDPGVSVLRDAISPQNRLNKITADSVVSSEAIAQPLRYIMDVAPELLQPKLNPQTGRTEPPTLPFDERVNSILALTAKGPAGQFPGPDADKVLAMKNDAEQEIARVTGVPSFYLSQTSGDVPSGESLRVLSSRLIAGVSTFQQDATPAWKGQLELLGLDGSGLQWADPAPMDAAEKWEIAQAKQSLGISLEDILTDLGESEVKEMLDRAQKAKAESAAAMGRAFMAGEGAASYGG